MKRQIVIFSGFNRCQFNPQPKLGEKHRVLTEEWIAWRFYIWRKYTWNSILNQSYTQWKYCLLCDSEARKLTDKYFGNIKDKRFYILYYQTPEEKQLMEKIAAGSDEIVNVRCDSDDCYHKQAISELVETIKTNPSEFYQFVGGYGYEYKKEGFGELFYYNPKHKSGPFFAHCYTRYNWLKQGTIQEPQHKSIRSRRPIVIDKRLILVGLHENTSTTMGMGCFRGRIEGQQRINTLLQFGIK
jgi:hypothetical protein